MSRTEPTTPVAAADATTTAIDRAPRVQVPVVMGIAPQSIDEAWRLASMLAKAGDLVPKPYRGAPEAIMAAIQLGMELGLAPMQALQSIAVIGGRPGLFGDGLLALVMASPLYIDHDEYYEVAAAGGVMERRDGLTVADLNDDRSAAVCKFLRRGKQTAVTRRFSIGQARKAGYIGIGSRSGKEGPWTSHPDRMLAMRARSWAARDAFPDVLRGLAAVEELRDVPPDDDRPRSVRRLSEEPRTPVDVVLPPADDDDQAPPPAGQDGAGRPPMPPLDLSHYCDWDAPGGDMVRALCGQLMPRRQHANDPTCPDCQAGLADRAGQLTLEP